LGCDEPFFHGRKEASFLVEIARNNIRYEPLWGCPGLGGEVRQLRFLLGREVNFHLPSDYGKAATKASQRP
jgi:hypothetical protein